MAFLKKLILCSTGILCFLNSLSSEALLEQVFKVPKDSFVFAFVAIRNASFFVNVPLNIVKKSLNRAACAVIAIAGKYGCQGKTEACRQYDFREFAFHSLFSILWMKNFSATLNDQCSLSEAEGNSVVLDTTHVK